MTTAGRLNGRSAQRFDLGVSVSVDGREGETHNLSANGMLIESASAPEIGAKVDMTLQYLVNGEDFALHCRGEVVRVQRRGTGYTVAVRLHQPLFTEEELAFLS